MATINVVLGAKTIHSMQLKKDILFIGRHSEADICLDNPLVSRRHAMLYKELGGWAVEDLSGKNGVYVNGKQVIKKRLLDGDTIEIGKYTLAFSQSKEDSERERDIMLNKPGARYRKSYDEILAEVSCEKKPEETEQIATSCVDESQETLGLSAFELASVRREMGKRRKPHLLALTVLDRKVYPLEKKTLTIGRAEDADIRVGGFAVGAIQAVIEEEGGVFFIHSSGGLASTRVNGAKLGKDKKALREGDEIEVGSGKLRFMAGTAAR
jgi:pSer/pThr/pTyr-binding forkhead associated (FHA) protein